MSASGATSQKTHVPQPVVLITGAGSGIGEATAARFSQEGWSVVLAGRRKEALEKVKARLKTEAFVFPLDVASENSDQTTAEWIKANKTVADRISVVVHNAGIFERATTAESSMDSWSRMFETNLFGVVRLTKVLFPILKRNGGAIVNVSSTLGLRPTPDTAAYSASKAALLNWSAAFAKEAGPLGVRINSVCPGIVDTPIHSFHSAENKTATIESLAPLQPLGRIGQPRDIAHMIWSLSGPGSEWTTGATVCVDGGINL